jgi:hypothetical protein
MGVDWYPCERCGNTFPDCGDYTTCYGKDEGCMKEWCSDKCAEADGHVYAKCDLDFDACRDDAYGKGDCDEDVEYCDGCKHYTPDSCKYCRCEDFSDDEVLKFALERLDMEREHIIKLMIAEKTNTL